MSASKYVRIPYFEKLSDKSLLTKVRHEIFIFIIKYLENYQPCKKSGWNIKYLL